MTKPKLSIEIISGAAVAAGPALATETAKAITLPPPRTKGGMPLIETLALRRSTRDYSDRPIPLQVLSNLLWAAFGANRPNGDRTAPYWRHIMVIDVYLAMADGVWIYDSKDHALLSHSPTDLRVQLT